MIERMVGDLGDERVLGRGLEDSGDVSSHDEGIV